MASNKLALARLRVQEERYKAIQSACGASVVLLPLLLLLLFSS